MLLELLESRNKASSFLISFIATIIIRVLFPRLIIFIVVFQLWSSFLSLSSRLVFFYFISFQEQDQDHLVLLSSRAEQRIQEITTISVIVDVCKGDRQGRPKTENG